MFCPKCRCEYRDGFTTCTDCKEELVDQLPEEDKDLIVAINPIKIESVANDIDAELIINLLQNNNIPCFKKNKGAGGYMNILMGYSIFGEDIYVDKNDYEAAMAILNDLQPDKETMDDESIPMDYHVPFYKNPHTVARIILIVIAGTSILVTLIDCYY